MRVLDIVEGTTVDGPGLRTSIYVAGCRHQCDGCHNPQSWDFNAGKEMSIDEVLEVVRKNDFNVTLSGGDPFYMADDVAELCRRIKDELHKNIWCYTGYLFENLVKNENAMKLLKHLDVLVDGPFRQELRDEDLLYRGSSNQRLVDVQKSLAAGKFVEYDYNPYKLK